MTHKEEWRERFAYKFIGNRVETDLTIFQAREVESFIEKELSTAREEMIQEIRYRVMKVKGYGKGNLVPRENLLRSITAITSRPPKP